MRDSLFSPRYATKSAENVVCCHSPHHHQKQPHRPSGKCLIDSLECLYCFRSDSIVLEEILIVFVVDRTYLTFRCFGLASAIYMRSFCGNVCHFRSSKCLIVIYKCCFVLQGSCRWTNDSHPAKVGVTQAPAALICVGGGGNCFKQAFLSSLLSYNLYGLHAIMIQLSFALINKNLKLFLLFFYFYYFYCAIQYILINSKGLSRVREVRLLFEFASA